MLSAHWEKRRTALTQLQVQLQSLPTFISELDAITANIAHLEGDFEEMESRLVYLETLCCQCEQQTVKQHHVNQLEVYKKKKRREMEVLEVELNSEHAQKVAELEQAMQQKLKERQKVYEEAFNQDVQQYLSTGFLQHRDVNMSDISSGKEVNIHLYLWSVCVVIMSSLDHLLHVHQDNIPSKTQTVQKFLTNVMMEMSAPRTAQELP
ncbi:dysbindin-A-like [Anarrhichthys ocellatus]|uniref:dysbindin-A-like n=1 Tax=Anarrhichthys ocellatus TaxID=433405 RepID=UPI0012EDF28E|nr:dysbindin-A-like [Anarrhichthys ocellatus]